ncbi:MAG: hypothetical protein ABL886_02695 [Rhodoglobus sp.]
MPGMFTSASRAVVDVDDPSTWPPHVARWVEGWADELRGTTRCAYDLKIPFEEQDAFLALFDGLLVRAYHCTRLLDHERAMILTQGLRPLSSELVVERIRAAYAVGALSKRQRDELEQGHVLVNPAPHWRDQREHREGKVCLILGRECFDSAPSGVNPLLTLWGGEAVSFPMEATMTRRRRSPGIPSIVVAHVDVAASPKRDPFTPPLACSFVGAQLGLEDVSCELHHRGPVLPSCIERVLQPGHQDYDRHRQLPKR